MLRASLAEARRPVLLSRLTLFAASCRALSLGQAWSRSWRLQNWYTCSTTSLAPTSKRHGSTAPSGCSSSRIFGLSRTCGKTPGPCSSIALTWLRDWLKNANDDLDLWRHTENWDFHYGQSLPFAVWRVEQFVAAETQPFHGLDDDPEPSLERWQVHSLGQIIDAETPPFEGIDYPDQDLREEEAWRHFGLLLDPSPPRSDFGLPDIGPRSYSCSYSSKS